MKRNFLFLFSIFFVLGFSCAKEYIVKISTSKIQVKKIKEIFKKEKLSVKKINRKKDLFLVDLNIKGADLKKIKKLEDNGYIQYFQLNHRYKLKLVPDDNYYSHQWGMTYINMPHAWDYTVGSKEVVVAIIDSGIDINHEDLKNNIWRNPDERENKIDDDGNGYIDDLYGWNFKDNNNNVVDVLGHGTFVSGIIGAIGNNSIGIAGINYHISLMALNCFGNSTSTDDFTIAEAFDYAINKDVKVINASWGDYFFSDVIRDRIAECQKKGIIVVAAAGNEETNMEYYPMYPASLMKQFDNVLSIGSISNSGEISSFSNFGRNTVLCFLPGDNCYSTKINNSYGLGSGTSYATPFMTGFVALLYSFYPYCNYHYIRGKIYSSFSVNESRQNMVLFTGDGNFATPFENKNYEGPQPFFYYIEDVKENAVVLNFEIFYNNLNFRAIEFRVSENYINNENFFYSEKFYIFPKEYIFSNSFFIKNLEPFKNYFIAYKIIDLHGNYSPMSEVYSFRTAQEDIIFYDGAESENENIFIEGNWHKTNYFSYRGNYSWAIYNEESGTYDDSQNSYMYIEGVNFDELINPTLEFYHRYNLAGGDYVSIEISFDNKNWEVIKKYTNIGEAWKKERVFLPQEKRFKLRFHFHSSSYSKSDDEEYFGYFLDEIKIKEGNNIYPEKDVYFEAYNVAGNQFIYYNEEGMWEDYERRSKIRLGISNRCRIHRVNNGGAKIEFCPFFKRSGYYAIYATWGVDANAKNIILKISNGKDIRSIPIIQNSENSNKWVYLGDFLFRYGKNNLIEFDSLNAVPFDNSKEGIVFFDLFKFVFRKDVSQKTFIKRSKWNLYN